MNRAEHSPLLRTFPRYTIRNKTQGGEQRLCDDIVIDILELHIRIVGVQGNVGLLVLNRTITRRLYPSFYHSIKLWERMQLKRLCRTLLSYPQRVPLIKALWVCIGRQTPCFPRFLTLDYPNRYRGDSCQERWISGFDIALVGYLLVVAAPFVERVTILTNDEWRLLDVFQSLPFPNLTHLEIPSALMTRICALQMPRLTHLRLAINFRCGSTKVLDDHVLFEYPLLTHVYLSIYVAEGMDVADHVRQLRTPVTVQTLAIEVNMGQNLPVECHALWQYDIHPKVVFMVDKEWEQHASRGLEEREWEQVNQCLCLFSENQWREEQAQSLMLVKAGGRSDIWEEIDIKVKQRWSDFDEGFAAFEEERKEVLANPNHFVSLNVFS